MLLLAVVTLQHLMTIPSDSTPNAKSNRKRGGRLQHCDEELESKVSQKLYTHLTHSSFNESAQMAQRYILSLPLPPHLQTLLLARCFCEGKRK